MIISMTGFGRAEREFVNKKIAVEIKSLNSKQLDMSIRIPGVYKSKDLDVRTVLSKALHRGKIELFVHVDTSSENKKININKELAMAYHKDLQELAAQLGMQDNTNYLSLLVKMPEVMKTEKQELDEEEWGQIQSTIVGAIDELIEFRTQEGNALQIDLQMRINNILSLLEKIEALEPQRKKTIKQRISGNLEEFIGQGKVDQNRFEQELIYYLEKLDITEEKVRLKNHGAFFLETMEGEKSEGKKLSFIAQEIGREINTIGSKANDAEMQKSVVEMKDELEKIKEQLLNVL
ncbi:MAG: YicC family protein [Flavobacteriales bacterium]|nr:MAG: YicC family protein [Flavobacteriales bacterium]